MQINLLPHREWARQRARRHFRWWLGLALLAGVVVAGALHTAWQVRIDRQLGRNAWLGAELARLDEEVEAVARLRAGIAALQARQAAVERLQADRNRPVQLLSEAVRRLPDGVVLRRIEQSGHGVVLTGAAQSSERVSELLRRLAPGGDGAAEPELVEIVAARPARDAAPHRVYHFVVRAPLGQAAGAAPVRR